jgi:hypothetical protein
MATTNEAQREISMHRVPCGPMSIKASGVCRRRLRDNFGTLLDRLSQETGPEQPTGPEMPEGYEMMPDGTVMSQSHLKAEEMKKAEKKAKKEGKDDPVGKLAEALSGTLTQKHNEMGNSKMTQDTSGKIEPFKEGKNAQTKTPK